MSRADSDLLGASTQRVATHSGQTLVLFTRLLPWLAWAGFGALLGFEQWREIGSYRFWYDEQWRALIYSDPFAQSAFSLSFTETPVPLLLAVLHYMLLFLFPNNEQTLLIPNAIAFVSLPLMVGAIAQEIFRRHSISFLAALLVCGSSEFLLHTSGLKSHPIDIAVPLGFLLGLVMAIRRRPDLALLWCAYGTLLGTLLSVFFVFFIPGISVFSLAYWAIRRPMRFQRFALHGAVAGCLATAHAYWWMFRGKTNPEFYRKETLEPWDLLVKSLEIFVWLPFSETKPLATLAYPSLQPFLAWVYLLGVVLALTVMTKAAWKLCVPDRQLFDEQTKLFMLVATLCIYLSGIVTPFILHLSGHYAFSRSNNLNLHLIFSQYALAAVAIASGTYVLLFHLTKGQRAVRAALIGVLLLCSWPTRLTAAQLGPRTYGHAYLDDMRVLIGLIRSDLEADPARRVCLTTLHTMLWPGAAYYAFHHHQHRDFFRGMGVRFMPENSSWVAGKDARTFSLQQITGPEFSRFSMKHCDRIYRITHPGVGPVIHQQASNALAGGFWGPKVLRHFQECFLERYDRKASR